VAFTHYKSATLAATQAGSEDSADWPLTICLDGNVQAPDADLKTLANGGYVRDANGYDIRPYAADLTTPLDYELVYYDGTSGRLEMHVKIPTLSHTSDTVIYLKYGDASLNSDGSSSATWNSSYKLVHHYKDGSSLTTTDSTSNGADGTAGGASAATGQIGGGANFNGTSDYISTGVDFELSVAQTWSAWINATTFEHDGLGAPRYILQQEDLGQDNGLELFVYQPGSNNRIGFVGAEDTTYQIELSSSTDLSTDVWYHVAAQYDGSNAYIYVNGALDGSTAQLGSIGATDRHFYIGRYNNYPGSWFSGTIDEVRVSDDAKSASWILVDYNSQKASSTFIEWGSNTAATASYSGARSMLAPWMGGAASDAAPPGGYRSMLAFWSGGAASITGPAPTAGGYRSMLAFWVGGAGVATEVEPSPPSPGVIGPPYRFHVPGDLSERYRRKLIEEDELLLLMAAQIVAAGLLH
jgi:hypothetical protein